MLELQKIIKTENFLDKIDTQLVIGATMRVKIENYDALINELINIEKNKFFYYLKKYFP